MSEKERTTYPVGPLSYSRTKQVLEETLSDATREVWQSGGAGRMALREEIREALREELSGADLRKLTDLYERLTILYNSLVDNSYIDKAKTKNIVDLFAGATGVLYTTPANRIAYITRVSIFGINSDAAAIRNLSVDLRDEADAVVITLAEMSLQPRTAQYADNIGSQNFIFNPPKPVPAGYDLHLTVGANILGRCFVHGWEEEV